MILLVSFAFAMIVFRVRIQGSVVGFLGISIACALMASTFGLLVAALGNSPATARGVTTLAVLMMVMLGGAWVPTFIFPAWLQQFTLVVPVRWAVDGLDAMTWRGIGLTGAIAADRSCCSASRRRSRRLRRRGFAGKRDSQGGKAGRREGGNGGERRQGGKVGRRRTWKAGR